MPNHDENILVLGAGELGMSILRELANPRLGYRHITVLLRPTTVTSTDPLKQKELSEIRDLGVHFLPGDLVDNSEAQLAHLFKGFHTIVSATGYVAGLGIQLKLARAVLEAGVPRYFPWQFGVDYDVIGKGSAQDLFDEQLDVRALLRAQTRTEWVIISTGVFTSFLFAPFFGIVDLDNAAVHALGSLDNRITTTTVEDIGRLTAKIICAEPRIRNTVVFVGGDTLSYSELADIVDSLPATKGRPVQRDTCDLPTLQRRLKSDPNNTINKYLVVFATGRGVAWDLEQTYNSQHNIPVASARQWALEHLA